MIEDDRARELAAEILSRPEYVAFRRSPTALQELFESVAAWIEGVLDLIPQWLVDLWDGFWDSVANGFGFALGDDALVVLFRLVFATGVLAAFGFAALWVIRELRERTAETSTEDEAVEAREPEWMADAEAFAQAGRYVEAAHCAQLASLQLLLRKRWLELERSDPNRTLRRRMAEAQLPSSVSERFLALLDRLEGCWFRDRVGDAELYTDWRGLHAEISALPEGAR